MQARPLDLRAKSESLAVTLLDSSVDPLASTGSYELLYVLCFCHVMGLGEGASLLINSVGGEGKMKDKHKQACVTGPGHGRVRELDFAYEHIVQRTGSVEVTG